MVRSSAVNPQIRAFYSNITSQTLSPCKKFLIAGNNYCELFVFDLQALENPDPLSENYAPVASIYCESENQCTALTSTDKFLIVGAKGKIFGYDWKFVSSSTLRSTCASPAQPGWAWNLPSKRKQMEEIQVDALLEVDGRLYAGCSDNNIYVFSMEDGSLIRTLSKHTGYIHDVKPLSQNRIASAGEDGSVIFWDILSSNISATIEPWKEAKLARPNLGKWVGCLDTFNDTWLLCGGGFKASLWHLPSMQLTTDFDTSDDGHHVGKILDDRVLLGGKSKLNQLSLNGNFLNCISTSSSVIYSVVMKDKPKRVLSISGNSPYLDICFSLEYRDTILSCFK